MAQVAAVIVATSTGRTLADELSSRGSYTHLIEGPDGVPKVLLGVNGQPVLNHWLAAIKAVPRLTPIEEKVFILCNENNVEHVRAWAADPRTSLGGFPLDNVLTNGSDDSLGFAGDLAAFLAAAPPAAQLSSASLVVVEGDGLVGPGFGLSRVVEHTVVRGKDTLTYMAAPEGMPLEGQAVLGLEDAANAYQTASQRVEGLDAAANGIADPMAFTPVLAPVAVLRPETVARAAGSAGAGPSPYGTCGLGYMLAGLRPGDVAHPPMYAMPVDSCFRLGDAYSLQLASNFFAYYATEKAGGKGEAAKALDAARRLAQLNEARTMAGGSLAGAVKLVREVESARPPEPCVDAAQRKLYNAFFQSWLAGDRHHDVGATVGRGGVSAAGGGDGAGAGLPLRFADVTTRKHNPKQQHPVYQTSNSIYGAKAPSQLDMPLSYSSSSQAFTRAFPVTAAKNSCMVTSVTRSNVHKALDDF
ncbi:hypothetical protein CHLRE_12g485000v5 [Chlamydomonas reinhardtii]|uniref:Uncharacterized protein n=1 Tax=Chlamydomonas reinhardtii TaxID=3055 RepID=A8JHR6_CHLRE|nr:uncharacterized protein CHLRE_12g485000v5 [Chlamydomonas reinhardtii]6U42_7H Chain 7H, FAP182 [Chlamydomonas reinhardtii]6U42_7X Chain 7X, FAP182 [Chlamydomonas reinhardtii]8GLV_7H Chain 7H, Flagellar associated protein [Chlamydomonas reinhardtii]8GLV_7X Chain 7X, Flagellar associated protein [Chlamydomonas reinhardtii]PNW74461.1 hypothetical protein CHLRE_12g485000v5 [Chlamydomonas reinhardtii]|eukprot:XP_001703198.1 flagellar associated protein [Chlamydomonas reinhardtii]